MTIFGSKITNFQTRIKSQIVILHISKLQLIETQFHFIGTLIFSNFTNIKLLMKADVYLWLPLYVALILQREAVDPLSLQDESVRYLGSTNLCLSNVMTVSCSKNLQSLASSRQLLQEFNRFAEFNISLPLLDVQLRNVINVAEPQWNVSSGNLLLSHHCDLKQSQRQWPNIASKSELSYDHKRSKVKCKWSASRSLYYNNSTASFNILTCGDVHPQPGPNLRMESKPKKKTSR